MDGPGRLPKQDVLEWNFEGCLGFSRKKSPRDGRNKATVGKAYGYVERSLPERDYVCQSWAMPEFVAAMGGEGRLDRKADLEEVAHKVLHFILEARGNTGRRLSCKVNLEHDQICVLKASFGSNVEKGKVGDLATSPEMTI